MSHKTPQKKCSLRHRLVRRAVERSLKLKLRWRVSLSLTANKSVNQSVECSQVFSTLPASRHHSRQSKCAKCIVNRYLLLVCQSNLVMSHMNMLLLTAWSTLRAQHICKVSLRREFSKFPWAVKFFSIVLMALNWDNYCKRRLQSLKNSSWRPNCRRSSLCKTCASWSTFKNSSNRAPQMKLSPLRAHRRLSEKFRARKTFMENSTSSSWRTSIPNQKHHKLRHCKHRKNFNLK